MLNCRRGNIYIQHYRLYFSSSIDVSPFLSVQPTGISGEQFQEWLVGRPGDSPAFPLLRNRGDVEGI